ncbi:NUDIX hydrolase [Micromonospora sp. NBC_00858]|nr:NUDIX hydrolase [Micromonospora sp. NBC_00858]
MATPRIAAGALFLDEEGRVLLVRPSYKKHWEIPGGFVEPGESPPAASKREIARGRVAGHGKPAEVV